MFRKLTVIFLFIILLSVSSFAQNQAGIEVKGGAFLPQGDMGDMYKTGFGGTAGITYALSERFQLSGSAGYISFSFDNSIFDGTPIEGTEVDATLNLIPIMAGARYFFSSSDFKPYANINLGLHIFSFSGDDTNVENESETKTGWAIGVGFLIKAGNKMHVDINAGFNGTALEFKQEYSESGPGYISESSSSSTGTWFGLTAGLHFAL